MRLRRRLGLADQLRLISAWVAVLDNDVRQTLLEPRLLRAQLANRHATELVDRLLSERNALRALLHDYFPRVAKARVRLRQWQEGDGSRRRDVLADLEDILG